MAGLVESSSTQLKNDKPVVVRVKRKASQSCLDALWLEINERPTKRPLLDFNKLAISESSKKDEELKSRKVFVRHVETVTTPDVSMDTLQSFLSASSDALPSREKSAGVGRALRTENVASRNALFEQIRRSEKEKKDFVNDQDEMCRIYDVVRVDVEVKSKVDRLSEMEDCKMMSQFLPLLKEFLPSAAAEVEADIHESLSERDMPDDYVYDYYAVEDNMDITMEDAASVLFPLVQVDDDDTYYDGPDDSDDESYDSNAENNPLHEYPDEESSDTEDNLEDGSSSDKSETHERSSNAESKGDDDDDDGDGDGSGRSCEADEKDEEYDWSEGGGGAEFSYEDGAEFSYEDGEFHSYEDYYDDGVGVDVESDHYEMDS